jgi:hypothetical protein
MLVGSHGECNAWIAQADIFDGRGDKIGNGPVTASTPRDENQELAGLAVFERKVRLFLPRVLGIAVTVFLPKRLVGVAELVALGDDKAIGDDADTLLSELAAEEFRPPAGPPLRIRDIFTTDGDLVVADKIFTLIELEQFPTAKDSASLFTSGGRQGLSVSGPQSPGPGYGSRSPQLK